MCRFAIWRTPLRTTVKRLSHFEMCLESFRGLSQYLEKLKSSLLGATYRLKWSDVIVICCHLIYVPCIMLAIAGTYRNARITLLSSPFLYWKAYLVYNLNIYNTKIKPTHPNGSRSGPVCHSSRGPCGYSRQVPGGFGPQIGPRRVLANFLIIKNYEHQPGSVRVPCSIIIPSGTRMHPTWAYIISP